MSVLSARDRQIHEELNLKKSVFFHLFFIFLMWAGGNLLPKSSPNYTPVLRVDLVGLPSQTQKIGGRPKLAPPPVPAAKATPDEAPPDEEGVLPSKKKPKEKEKAESKPKDDSKNRMQNILSRMKALDKVKGDESDANETEEGTGPILGNKISKGSSLEGVEADEGSYVDSVLTKLKDNWALPVWLQQQNLSAAVRVRIDFSGRLVGIVFDRSSGNPQFDEEVRRAIRESAPFPPPPKKNRVDVLSDGLPFGFPL
jgi:TonB family protein